MRVLIVLIQIAAIILASPLSPFLIPRSHVCQNAPNTIAGTHLPRHPPRSSPNTVFWCAPHSQTYITFTPLHDIPLPLLNHPLSLPDMLSEAYSYIIGHLTLSGDGLIPNGVFEWRNYGFSIRTWNANNHQTTWSVVGAAAAALLDYMGRSGWATVRFEIFDGGTQVGAGVME